MNGTEASATRTTARRYFFMQGSSPAERHEDRNLRTSGPLQPFPVLTPGERQRQQRGTFKLAGVAGLPLYCSHTLFSTSFIAYAYSKEAVLPVLPAGLPGRTSS